MSYDENSTIQAAIYGMQGTSLTAEEKAFFAEQNPLPTKPNLLI